VRNVFDQYEQPENRLTHALFTTLDQDRSLLVPFLYWLGIHEVPKLRALKITEQQVPGLLQLSDDIIEAKGLPDAAVFDDETWAVLFESKVQAHIGLGQVERHRRTATRHGFELPWVVLISVDRLSSALPEKTITKQWQEVYSWFNCRPTKSVWVRHLVQYMKVYERKQLRQHYDIRGTITVFDGLRFDEENPYTYREGKRLLQLLGDLLQNNKALQKIHVDPDGERRPAITGKGTDGVWDFLPLTQARGKPFTSFPHLTMVIGRTRAVAAVTVPNGVKGGFRSKLSAGGFDQFLELISELNKRLRPVVKRSKGVQPQWLEAIYDILIKKRSNIQFGIEVQFRYSCPRIRSRDAAALFADTWIALSPLIDFVLKA
jgi:hypothetical protein